MCRHAQTSVLHTTTGKLMVQRAQQLRGARGELSAKGSADLNPAEAELGPSELSSGKQTAAERPAVAGKGLEPRRPFAGRLTAVQPLQRMQARGIARLPAPSSNSASQAVNNSHSSTAHIGPPAAAAQQRPELSTEEQQLLHGAARGSQLLPPCAVDLSAFAELPAIPAWRATMQKPLQGTLRESFVMQLAQRPEEVEEDIAKP